MRGRVRGRERERERESECEGDGEREEEKECQRERERERDERETREELGRSCCASWLRSLGNACACSFRACSNAGVSGSESGREPPSTVTG